MKKIVFICRGNLIRSQICKVIFNKIGLIGYYAESYGTDVQIDGNEGVKVNQHEHPYLSSLIKIMKKHDLDISEEVSRQLTEENIKDSYKIIYMGRKVKIPNYLKKYNYEYWEDCLNEVEKNKDLNLNIQIPKFGDRDDIKQMISMLENKVKNLASFV